MEDKEVGVAQEEALTEEQQEPQDESQSVPQSEDEFPEDAKKTYEGKSPEELARMHYGLSKKLGEQGQVIGSLKELVEELRAGRVERKQTDIPNPFQSEFQRSQGVAPQEVSQEDFNDDDFLTVGKAKQMLQREQQQQQQWKRYETANRISVAFDEGKSTMKGDPIFEGIEKDVVQYVFEQNRIPFQMFGMDVSPYVRNPQTWRTAAVQIRAQRNEWDKISPPKSGGRVVPVTATETPSSATTFRSEPAVDVPMDDRDMQEFVEVMTEDLGRKPTRKEIEEAITKGREIWNATGTLDGRRFG